MKITIETDFVIAIVESKQGYQNEDNTEMSEAVELVQYVLLAVGFHPENIKKAFNENQH